ncbi:MAG: CARDB domain-containing protein [Myxococcota bacterium]
MRSLGIGLCTVGVIVAGCAQGLDVPDLPLSTEALETFWRHSDWRPRKDVQVDIRQAAPSRVQRFATSTNIGDIKVIEGDSTVVSTVSGQGGSGYGLRMDEARQDLARITRQVIDEEGDHFDFIVVFPLFEDLMNPGFAYFSNIVNRDSGIGLEQMDMSDLFGSNGRLQGFLNMNSPDAYSQVDGLPISDPASSVYPIMGQELTHRWLAFAKVKKEGFQDGSTSDVLLGRDQAHWSALMHTGPADDGAGIYTSVQDGVAWRDNADGTFTAVEVFSDQGFNISRRARFSTLDLYLMGFMPPEEVEPFFVIENARAGNQRVSATSVLYQGLTVTGDREDFTVEHVINALGPRVPAAHESQRDFNLAVVVLTQPGVTAADVTAQVELVESFRTQWVENFQEWTGQRARVCTALSGDCSTARLRLKDLTVTESNPDGAFEPGEALTVTARVINQGSATSAEARVDIATEGDAALSPTSVTVAPLAAEAGTEVSFTVTPATSFACASELKVTLTLTSAEAAAESASVSRVVGVRTTTRVSMESDPGWEVDPDGTDTAQMGRWRRGIPRRTDLRRFGASDVVFQPGDDASLDGDNAYFTEPGGSGLDPYNVSDTDVDDGETTLQTTEITLAGLTDPVLSFSTWHTAMILDLEQRQLLEAEEDDLVTEISADGVSWVEIDRDASNDFVWKRKSFKVKEIAGLPAEVTRVFLRFTVGDKGPEQNLVEAGVDELTLTDVSLVCQGVITPEVPGGEVTPPGSDDGVPAQDERDDELAIRAFGCSATGAPAGAELLVLVGLAGLLRRRR